MSMENSLQFVVGADLTPFTRGIEGAVDRVIGLGKLAVGIGLGAVATAIGKTGYEALQAASQMETFEVRLGTLMGSSDDARARLDELFAFAATTPFNTEQIVAAEVTLRGFGAAAAEVMPGLIDFAATTGADLSQSAIDIGKAWNQGAVGLESDTAKILRKQIELQAGTDVTKMKIEDFREAMLNVLDDGMFAGGAARMSRTFAGMVSNLQDSWEEFLRDVGKGSELFDNVKGSLQAILDLIANNQGLVQSFAAEFGDTLWTGIRYSTIAAAGLADAIRVGYGYANILAAAIDTVNAGLLSAQSSALGLSAALLSAAGQDSGAAYLYAIRDSLAAQADAADEAAAAHQRTAQAIFGDVAPASRLMIDLLNEAEAAQFDLETATTRTTGAVKDQGEEGAKAAKKIADAQLDAINAYSEFYYGLQHMRDTDGQAADAWRQDQLTKAQSLNEKMGGDYADFALLKSAIDDEYYARLTEISNDYEAHARDEAKKTAEDRAEFQARYAETSLNSLSSLLGTIGGMMDDSNAEQKEAAKALAYTQIGIQTAVGIMQAVGSAPWPYNLIPIGFAVASGAAAAIQVGQAHQGFAPAVSSTAATQPGERMTKTLDTEAILSSQLTRRLGPGGIRALEMGGGMGGGSINLRIGRVAQREIYRTDKRTGGAISGDIRRASASQDIATGMSGQRAA